MVLCKLLTSFTMNNEPSQANKLTLTDRIRRHPKVAATVLALGLTGAGVGSGLLGANKPAGGANTVRLETNQSPVATPTTEAITAGDPMPKTPPTLEARTTQATTASHQAHLSPGVVIHNTTTTSEPAHEAHLAPGEVVHREETTSTTSTTVPPAETTTTTTPTTSTTVG